MYHCHLHLQLAGRPCRAFNIIKEMVPAENFTHEFSESADLDEVSEASDVIFADLSDTDARESVRKLTAQKRKDAELIVMARREQIPLLTDLFSDIKDIWPSPMSDDEIKFRFLRWQQSRKMEADFRQTEQFFEATINNIPNLIWYKDKNGIHEKVNDSFCKAVNKTKEQVEGRGHAYIWDVEQDDPACIESEREVMSSKKTCVSEEIISTGEGQRTLTTYKSPLYDMDGSVMGTVGVAIDVTQERAYEQEIVRKNQSLETIFTTIDCGVMRHTLDGKRVLSVNRAALRILGYDSVDDMLADGFDTVAPTVVEEDRGRLRECIKELKNEGDIVSVEYRVRHSDGEILHVMGNVKLLREEGELCYQRFLLDCTVQKQQEKANERYHTDLIRALSTDYSLVCFFDLDTGEGALLQNDGSGGQELDSIFKGDISFEKSLGQYVERFVYEEDREAVLGFASADELKKALKFGKIHYVNYRILKNGDLHYFQMRAVCSGNWKESHGIVLGLHSVDGEIRSEMEKKSILEDALQQANKANRAKSVFLSNMSHDIRTPMNAIVGFTTLAINHISNRDQVEEYLKKIKMSGVHLLNLINDVLDMSRIESGKVVLDEKPADLSNILKSVYNILQTDAEAKQQKLIVNYDGVRNREIYCDSLRLNQVLLNLVSNAVKYTGEGGSISMYVTEKAGAPEGYGNYEFRVKDTGIGMSEEFLTHVFEPFEREENSTISGIQGTGLGMAITKNIVDMMNGVISVTSTQGAGTEFVVSFVFRLNRSDGRAEEKKEPVGIMDNGCRTGRILLVEDVELNQEIAAAILSDAGFEVEVADNGKEAVDMLAGSEPGYYSLVLMDVQMPVMNGYEATRAIRRLEDPELALIPIIAMTANAFEEDRQQAMASGMNGHISKPIDIETLFETLDGALR